MFAYRKVPQASTGFNLFEFLSAAQGFLDVLKEIWEAEPTRGQAVTEYVTQLRDKLAELVSKTEERAPKSFKWEIRSWC